MDVGIKHQWVEALRSDEYRQGRSHLQEGDRFCCLGVLCDLAVRAGVLPPPTEGLPGIMHYGRPGDRNAVALPGSVLLWAGLSAPEPFVRLQEERDGSHVACVTLLNDEGESFAVIADLIDEQDEDWTGVLD